MRTNLSRHSRRRFLQAGAAAIAAGVLPVRLSAQAKTSSTSNLAASTTTGRVWRNWSGIVSCQPQHILTPLNEAEIVKILQSSNQSLRCVGSGHSFTPLAATNTQMLSLDRLAGIVSHDAHSVTVHAGTRLAQLSRQLDERGLGLGNLPDIDTQTLAGAIATATHGTGSQLSALHADVLGMRLVSPNGEILDIQDAAMLAACRVSLGSLGVVTQLKLRVQAAYNLQRKVWLLPLEEMLQAAPELAKKHRHFEFYYLPHTGYTAAIAHDVYAGQDVLMPPAQDEDMLRDLQHLRDWAGRFPSLRRWLAGMLIDADLQETARNRSFKLLSNVRPTRFNESEFHVPQAHGIDCLRAVIKKLEQRNEVFFPLEFRYVQADDAWLSPFYQRASCSIAVHAAANEAHAYLVADLQDIFAKYQGRPHWGKLHGYSARELAALYPRWQDFLALRRKLDPQGRMLNPHLRTVFGIA